MKLNIPAVLCFISILTKYYLWSYLHVFLDLLVFLLSNEELSLRKGFSQCLLRLEGFQLQQSRHSTVLADETGAVSIKVNCGRKAVQLSKRRTKCSVTEGRNV